MTRFSQSFVSTTATALTGLALLTGAMANAATITGTMITTKASITAAGTDIQGPAGSGSLLSQLADSNGYQTDFGGDALARAGQNISGDGGVYVNGLYASPPDRIVLTAESIWEQTAEITGASPEALAMSLDIVAPHLSITDFAFVGGGLPANDNIVSYALSLLLNGAVVFESAAVLTGGRAGHTLVKSGADLGGIFFSSGGTIGYDFDSLVTSVPLGTFDPGETLSVEYRMTVTVDTPQLETGGEAFVGDPLNLSGPDAVTVQLITIPEPTTLAAISLGSLALVLAKRRR